MLCFAGQNVSRPDVWGSLSGGRVQNTLGSTGIMVRSVAQWNCQFRHLFANGFVRSFIVICNSVSQARSGTDCSSVVLATFLRIVLLFLATQSLQIPVELIIHEPLCPRSCA